MTDEPRIELTDAKDGPPRTTRTLLSSFVVRMHTLSVLTGGEAVASLLAGVAAHGREVSRTADGARLRRALEDGRAGANVQALWSALGLADAVELVPPSPVASDLRNDLALLLADDLDECLDDVANLDVGSTLGPVSVPGDVDPLDLLVGMWALGRDVADTVEALAAPTLPSRTSVERGDDAPLDGPLLR